MAVLKLLLDEMYPPALAEALRVSGIEARTVADVGLAGRSGSERSGSRRGERLRLAHRERRGLRSPRG